MTTKEILQERAKTNFRGPLAIAAYLG